MEEMLIQSVTDTQHMAPVRASINSKLEDERLSQKTVEPKKAERDTKTDPPKKEDVKKMVAELSHYVEKFSTRISFNVDPEKNEPTIIVKDKESRKVIREIPPKDMVMLNQKMEELLGIIFDERG